MKLDADESALLLITKHHAYKGVTSKHRLGTLEYIEDACKVRCAFDRVDMFSIYLPLCEKLLNPARLCDILKTLHEDVAFWKDEITPDAIIRHMISALGCRICTDLELDWSLIEVQND